MYNVPAFPLLFPLPPTSFLLLLIASVRTVCQGISLFCSQDLSAYYFSIVKDRLYCEPLDSPSRYILFIYYLFIIYYYYFWGEHRRVFSIFTKFSWFSLPSSITFHLSLALSSPPLLPFSRPRLAVQSVLMELLHGLLSVIAPIAPFTAEEV